MCKKSVRTMTLLGVVLLCAGTLAAQDKASAIRALLTGYHNAGVFNGAALVSENGKLIVESGVGLADFEWKIPNTPDTKFRLGSMTKQFTATLVLQLVEEGKLSIDSTLSSVLPYYRRDSGAKVTIHHLLRHTSGIPSLTDLPNFDRDVSRNPYAIRELIEKYCSGDLEFEPGTKYYYNNSGYIILGAIVEQVTGKNYEQALRERIFDPLVMNASGYDHSRTILEKRARGYVQALAGMRNADYLDMSIPAGAGSLYSTVEDLYTWDQALYRDQILSAQAKARMFTPGLQNYGYGWVIQSKPIGPDKADRLTIATDGGINGFCSLMVRVTEERHLVVLLNNTGCDGTLYAISDGIMDILYGRTPPPARRPVATVLYETDRKSGIAAAVAQYRKIKNTQPSEYDLSAGQLNRLGAELLAQKRAGDAIDIFKLNVEAFPTNSNAHNSLANAYREAGQTDLAISTYRKTLELDPSNLNAIEKLKELTKK